MHGWSREAARPRAPPTGAARTRNRRRRPHPRERRTSYVAVVPARSSGIGVSTARGARLAPGAKLGTPQSGRNTPRGGGACRHRAPRPLLCPVGLRARTAARARLEPRPDLAREPPDLPLPQATAAPSRCAVLTRLQGDAVSARVDGQATPEVGIALDEAPVASRHRDSPRLPRARIARPRAEEQRAAVRGPVQPRSPLVVAQPEKLAAGAVGQRQNRESLDTRIRIALEEGEHPPIRRHRAVPQAFPVLHQDAFGARLQIHRDQ